MKSSISGQISITEYLASLRESKPEPARPALMDRNPRKPQKAAIRAGRPDLSEDVRRLLVAGAGRPGSRIRIERSITENPGLSYEPIRTAADELAGVKSGNVEIYHRGVWDRKTGWYSWSLIVDWVTSQIKAGTWLSEEERRQEALADQARREKRPSWKREAES